MECSNLSLSGDIILRLRYSGFDVTRGILSRTFLTENVGIVSGNETIRVEVALNALGSFCPILLSLTFLSTRTVDLIEVGGLERTDESLRLYALLSTAS